MSRDKEYKERFKALTEKLGRIPTTKDKEYWELTEWHKETFERHVEPKQEPVAKQELTPIKAALSCKDCGKEIERTGLRGRPPTRCVECREKK